MGIATAVDLVCVDESNRLCLVEQKCGFEGYHTRGTGKMRHELAAHDNSPFFQHQLQLALTVWMFQKTFALSVPQAVVMRVVDGGVHLHQLTPEFRQAAEAAARRLKAEASLDVK